METDIIEILCSLFEDDEQMINLLRKSKFMPTDLLELNKLAENYDEDLDETFEVLKEEILCLISTKDFGIFVDQILEHTPRGINQTKLLSIKEFLEDTTDKEYDISKIINDLFILMEATKNKADSDMLFFIMMKITTILEADETLPN